MVATLLVRDPSGRISSLSTKAPSNVAQVVTCTRRAQMKGQWLITLSDGGQPVAVVHRGRSAARLAGAHIVDVGLDESGEEFVLVVLRGRIAILRLSLSTLKYSLVNHRSVVEHLRSLFGEPERGSGSMAACDAVPGREVDASERGLRILLEVGSLPLAIESVRQDLPRHDRASMGDQGLDALRTLNAWRSRPEWFRASSEASAKAVRCGADRFVEPLRTLPRRATGANLFLGALASALRCLARSMGRDATSRLAASIALACSQRAASFGLHPICDPRWAWRYFDDARLPPRSAALVAKMRHIRAILSEPFHQAPGDQGVGPYLLPSADRVFQQVAVAEVLISLGLEDTASLSSLDRGVALQFADYEAWGDSPFHGLAGWRDSTRLPSGYKPDLIVKRSGKRQWLLVDAKLRPPHGTNELLSASGIKDLQAYMQEYALPVAAMLVPDNKGLAVRTEDIEAGSYRIRAISVPCENWSENRRSLRDALEPVWCDARISRPNGGGSGK